MRRQDDYANIWQNEKYDRKSMEVQTDLFTIKGEQVRSKSELIIADHLTRMGISYRYEAPLVLRGLGTIYPDFTVLHVRKRKVMYWEHMGMMDHEDYLAHALKRIEWYEKNGYFPGDHLILTHETRDQSLSSRLLTNIIEHYLM